MLSVGRQLGIHNQVVVCRHCTWKDFGNKLAATLVPSQWVTGYLYVYCCPLCSSIDLAYEGKLLPFRPRATTHSVPPDTVSPSRSQESQDGHNKAKK